MINPFAFWKAVRHFSLTFAVVFASTLLGFSVTRLLGRLLGELSAPWLVALILPTILIGVLAKNESRWVPDEALRRRIAVWIVGGASMVWAVLFVARVWFGPEPGPRATPAPTPRGPVHRGPPGK